MTCFTLVTSPALEPVTVDEIKAQARIDTSAEDTLIGGLITAARQWIEFYTSRALLEQTWRFSFDNWPQQMRDAWEGYERGFSSPLDEAAFIVLPRPQLMAVTSVQVFDEDDVGTVWDSSNYFVDTDSTPGRLALRSGARWPVASRRANGICIEYKAGYGDARADVPEAVRLAVMQLATHWYEHRGDGTAANGASVPHGVKALLCPYRLQSVRL